MTIIHIVLFKFKSSLSPEQVLDASNDMVDLKNKCVKPDTKQPYILSSSGGRNNSAEPLNGGLTHGYVVEFASKEDRDYYIKEDPAHLAYVQRLQTANGGLVEDIRAIDYEPGAH